MLCPQARESALLPLLSLGLASKVVGVFLVLSQCPSNHVRYPDVPRPRTPDHKRYVPTNAPHDEVDCVLHNGHLQMMFEE